MILIAASAAALPPRCCLWPWSPRSSFCPHRARVGPLRADILAALLMPLSIDGTVAAASLVMLRAARLGQPVPWLGRAMLALAVLATLAANVGYGAAHGVPGALISGWPAIAFVGSVELAVTMVRRTRAAEPGKRAIEAYRIEPRRWRAAVRAGHIRPSSGLAGARPRRSAPRSTRDRTARAGCVMSDITHLHAVPDRQPSPPARVKVTLWQRQEIEGARALVMATPDLLATGSRPPTLRGCLRRAP